MIPHSSAAGLDRRAAPADRNGRPVPRMLRRAARAGRARRRARRAAGPPPGGGAAWSPQWSAIQPSSVTPRPPVPMASPTISPAAMPRCRGRYAWPSATVTEKDDTRTKPAAARTAAASQPPGRQRKTAMSGVEQDEARDEVATGPPAVGDRAPHERAHRARAEEQEEERADHARVLAERRRRTGRARRSRGPSCVHDRTVTTPIRSAIAPRMSRPPCRAAGPPLPAPAPRMSVGRTVAMSAATSRPGPRRPRVPGRPNRGTRNVTAGGPRAIPMFPPIEKSERPVALRSPATWFAVR